MNVRSKNERFVSVTLKFQRENVAYLMEIEEMLESDRVYWRGSDMAMPILIPFIFEIEHLTIKKPHLRKKKIKYQKKRR